MRLLPFMASAFTLALPSAAVTAQDVANGARIFDQRCATCHEVETGESGPGPNLAGVVGRVAGTTDGARYSRSMQELGITWDQDRLMEFLSNPRGMVRGTTMSVALRDETQRADVVAFLASLSDPADQPSDATN